MKNQMIENNVNGVKELVVEYMSETRSFQPNTNVSLKMLGTLLYLAQTKNLCQASNIDSNDSSLLLYMDLSYVDTFSGSMRASWEKKGIYNMGICSRLPKDDKLSDIVSHYAKELRKFNDPVEIFAFAEKLIRMNLTSEEYLEVFDFAIQQHAIAVGKFFGEFSQPKEFAQLVAALISSSCDTVFNPFAGSLSYATEIAHYTHFDAIEINRDIWELGVFRSALSDRYDSISMTLGDVANWPSKKFDAIVSTPPFRMKMNMVGSIFNRTEFSDTVALRRFESSTTENGELFTYVPLSVLVSDGEEDLRHELTSKGHVDTIITLPSGIMPHTNISTALIVLRKAHTVDMPIRMINAGSLFTEIGKRRVLDVEAVLSALDDPAKSSKVSIVEIEHNQWSWDVNVYNESLERQHPEGYSRKKLGDIVDSPVLERHFDDSKGALVKISDLSDSPYDYIKSPSDFPIGDDLRNTVKCSEPVLLLSTVRALKPTFCEASKETPIFVSRNIAAFKLLDPGIDTGYLCCELSDAQLMPSGAFIPNFTRSSILRMNLYFPPTIEEQKKLFQARKKEAKLGQAKELGLQEVIDSMKAEYINIIRTRKHDMRPYVRELGSVERIMRHYVSQRENMDDFTEKMTSLLDQYHIALNKLSELIDIFSEEDKFGKPEAFNVDKFLYDLEINNDKDVSGYSIEYDCDDNALQEYGLPVHKSWSKAFSLLNDMVSFMAEIKKDDDIVPLIIDIAPLDFERMIRNIIENARTHGFTDPKRDDYFIGIDLTVNAERDMFQIDFSNNGMPLPKGMDKNRYGLLGEKAGITGGSGRGGYVVKSIVEHYHGDYDIFMDGEKTVVRILLPISKQYGE